MQWSFNTLVVIPPLSKNIESELDRAIHKALEVAATAPQKREDPPQPRWTLWVITHIDRDRQKLRISS